MIFRTLFFLSIFIVLSVSFAFAADKSGAYSVLGEGTMSCGTLVQSVHNAENTDKVIIGSWVNGYLTAINQFKYKRINVAQGTDREARELWIYNYCQKNPLDNLATATSSLYAELLKKY